jgi:hypothetical protein
MRKIIFPTAILMLTGPVALWRIWSDLRTLDTKIDTLLLTEADLLI